MITAIIAKNIVDLKSVIEARTWLQENPPLYLPVSFRQDLIDILDRDIVTKTAWLNAEVDMFNQRKDYR